LILFYLDPSKCSFVFSEFEPTARCWNYIHINDCTWQLHQLVIVDACSYIWNL